MNDFLFDLLGLFLELCCFVVNGVLFGFVLNCVRYMANPSFFLEGDVWALVETGHWFGAFFGLSLYLVFAPAWRISMARAPKEGADYGCGYPRTDSAKRGLSL